VSESPLDGLRASWALRAPQSRDALSSPRVSLGAARAACSLPLAPRTHEPRSMPGDELHREEGVALVYPELVQYDEPRVHDTCERSELGLEPSQLVGPEPLEPLERHACPTLAVHRLPDLPEAPLTDEAKGLEAGPRPPPTLQRRLHEIQTLGRSTRICESAEHQDFGVLRHPASRTRPRSHTRYGGVT
jgi:hypothetical protein